MGALDRTANTRYYWVGRARGREGYNRVIGAQGPANARVMLEKGRTRIPLWLRLLFLE